MSEKTFTEDVALDFCYMSAETIEFMEDKWEPLMAQVSDFDDPMIKKELNLMRIWWRARLQHIKPQITCDEAPKVDHAPNSCLF